VHQKQPPPKVAVAAPAAARFGSINFGRSGVGRSGSNGLPLPYKKTAEPKASAATTPIKYAIRIVTSSCAATERHHRTA
jgi:hypothetical protein